MFEHPCIHPLAIFWGFDVMGKWKGNWSILPNDCPYYFWPKQSQNTHFTDLAKNAHSLQFKMSSLLCHPLTSIKFARNLQGSYDSAKEQYCKSRVGFCKVFIFEGRLMHPSVQPLISTQSASFRTIAVDSICDAIWENPSHGGISHFENLTPFESPF